MKKTIIIAISLLVLLILFAGCIGQQVYDAFSQGYTSTHQTIQNVDANGCCKVNTLKNAPGCICPEVTTVTVNQTVTP
jgi:hypothetical protein